MAMLYRTLYRDARGEIATAIASDGKKLRLALGGVELEGSDFEALEVVRQNDIASLERLTFSDDGALRACTLEMMIPLTVLKDGGEEAAVLEVTLALGTPGGSGGSLAMTLLVGELRVPSSGRAGWFDDQLAEIARALPAGWHLKTCWGCGLSDYSPYGTGMFGGLACFRDARVAYRAVRSKVELWPVWDHMTEFVQETHVCPEFERRTPGTGYRG